MARRGVARRGAACCPSQLDRARRQAATVVGRAGGDSEWQDGGNEKVNSNCLDL